jgi:Holliday junction DNA helicase RuvA
VVDQGVDGGCIVDVSGVGYEVFVPVRSVSGLPRPPEPTTLHVHTHVAEAAFTLFGFTTLDDRRAFRALLGVNAVGPKLALSILGDLSAAELSSVVARGDVKRLTRISGVGKKTAERLVLELKDKLAALLSSPGEIDAPGDLAAAPTAAASPNSIRRLSGPAGDVVGALVGLGFGRAEAEAAALSVVEPEDERPVEALLRLALGKLG